MLPAVVVVGVAIAAKGAALAYVLRIATASTGESKRTEMLDHAGSILQKLEAAGKLPEVSELRILQTDIMLLRKNCTKGWLKPEEFAAAVKVSNFIFWKEAQATVSGVGELASNSAKTAKENVGAFAKATQSDFAKAKESFDSFVDSLFKPPHNGSKDKNMHL